jgi:hypothetical protein
MWTERGPDRRWRARDPARLAPERRDGFDRRASPMPAPSTRGMIRPGVGETAPLRERRQDISSGLE